MFKKITGIFSLALAVVALQMLPNLAMAQVIGSYDENWVGVWRQGTCTGSGMTLVANGMDVVTFTGLDIQAEVSISKATFRDRLILLTEGGRNQAIATSGLTECSGLPSKLQIAFGEAMSLFLQYGELVDSCSQSTSDLCVRNAFALADVTGDGLLSRAEISRIGRATAFFVGYETAKSLRSLTSSNSHPQSVIGSDLYGSTIASNLVAPVFSANILASYDYDSDGLLSFDELLLDRESVNVEDLSLLIGPETFQTGITTLLDVFQQLRGLSPSSIFR